MGASGELSSKVYSTGQTMDDFIQLAKLASYLPKEDLRRLSGGRMVPPVLIDPNYIPPNRGPTLLAVNATTCALAIVAVSMRLYYSHFQSRFQRLLFEDYLMVLSLVMTITMTVVNCYGAAVLQWGMVITDLKIESLEKTSIILFIYQFTVAYNMTLIRISVVLFFRRLYAQTGSRTVWYCNLIIGVSCCVVISTAFASTFACNPVSGGWSIWVRYETHGCGAQGSYMSGAIIQVLLDMAVVAVPIRLVLSLSSSWQKKLQIFFLLAVGCLSWVAALVRLLYVHNSAAFEWKDVTNAILCSQFEATVATVCACVPMLKSLWVRSENPADRDLCSRIVRSVRNNPRRRRHDEEMKPSKDLSAATTNTVESGMIGNTFVGGVISVRAMKGTTPIFMPEHETQMSDLGQVRKPEPAVVVSHASGGEEYYEDIGVAVSRTITRSSTPGYDEDDVHTYRGRDADDSSRLAVRSRDPSIGSSYGRSSRESTYSNICEDTPMSGLGYARRNSYMASRS